MLRVASFLALLGGSAAAFAGFTIEGSPASSSEWGEMGQRLPYESEAKASFRASGANLEPQQARYKNAQLVVDLAYKAVTQKGSGRADRIDGFADDVPFLTAISMIIPNGWQLYQGDDLLKKDVPKEVSYIGGKPWPDVLSQIGERYALKFHVDWYDRTIMMGKGRASPIQQASRIRVIAEPAPVSVAKPAPKPVASASPAKAVAVAGAKPLTVSGQGSTLPRPVLNDAGKQVASSQGAVPPKPVEVKPASLSLQVRSGTLHENVIRLSKENSWEAPSWTIDSDFRIPAPYAIQAKDFAEAMVKLLMIHPIEADVNTAQRKIYVLKEIR